MTKTTRKSLSNDQSVEQGDVLLEDATVLETTEDGFGRVQAFIAREGVRQYNGWRVDEQRFGYTDTTVGVLMPSEEIRDPDFLASIGHSPMTVGHPWEGLVDITNYGEYNVGECSTDACVVTKDGEERVLVTLWIKDIEGIAAIRAGTKQLSMGFRHIWEMVDGVYTDSNGTETPYVAIQRRLRCNHVAIVEFGKAGPDCAIATDSAELKQWVILDKVTSQLGTKSNDAVPSTPLVQQGDTTMSNDNTKPVVLSADSVLQLPAADALAVNAHLTAIKTANDEAVTQLKAEHKTALDTANDQIKTLTEENATLKTSNDGFVAAADAAVKATLVETVTAMGHSIDGVADMTTRGIQEAALKLIDPSTDYSADSDETVNAVFTLASKSKPAVSVDSVTGKTLEPVTSNDAVADMVKRQSTARTV